MVLASLGKICTKAKRRVGAVDARSGVSEEPKELSPESHFPHTVGGCEIPIRHHRSETYGI